MDQNKAIGAGVGGGLGGSLATLIISGFWHNASPETAAALATVLSAIVSYVGAYIIPHKVTP